MGSNSITKTNSFYSKKSSKLQALIFLHDYLLRMTLQLGGDVRGYPTMPSYLAMPVVPVWVDEDDEEDDNDDEDDE